MDQMLAQYRKTKKKYDSNKDALEDIKLVAVACIEKIQGVKSETWPSPLGKSYTIFSEGKKLSRPFLTNQIVTADDFEKLWDALLKSADRERGAFTLPEEQVTKTLYNAIVPFCVCFDIWKTASRKTPGTFFEVVLGSLLGLIVPVSATRTKHIPLPNNAIEAVAAVGKNAKLMDIPEKELFLEDEGESILIEQNDVEEIDTQKGEISQVATDIVFDFNGKGIVIPAKITTRERIVQPFAHQRILDGVFGNGRYTSLITCVSETQRADDKRRVNEICVPGTIALFQKHLAKVGGIYYLDPPDRYLTLGHQEIVPVDSLGALLTSNFATIIKRLNQAQSA